LGYAAGVGLCAGRVGVCGWAGMCPCKGWPGGHAKRGENGAAGSGRKKKAACAGLWANGYRCEKGADAVHAAAGTGAFEWCAGGRPGGVKRKAVFCM